MHVPVREPLCAGVCACLSVLGFACASVCLGLHVLCDVNSLKGQFNRFLFFSPPNMRFSKNKNIKKEVALFGMAALF